ncbi:MAG: DUF3656 domain-containing protein [Terrimicrobiaceae bacterium]
MMVPELLSPAGDWNCLRAAVANGADAVYFGLPRFNARMRAENFRREELPGVVDFLHKHGVKAYVTLNVLIFTDELEDAVAELRLLNDSGVDAAILQDVGLAEISRRMFPALRVHASTQMTITSPEGVRFAKELGAKQVVLARELSLRELAKFESDLPLEVFVHGALCVAYSGQCLTSESLGQRSANRGECAQACRMPYEIVVDGAVRDLGDKRYLLSPQDLVAVPEIPELTRLGIRSFKIEGRLKTAEYVAAVTSVYRKAIDAAMREQELPMTARDRYRLEMTFSRGLFSGWLHGVNHPELVGARYGKKRGAFLGEVSRTGRGFVEIENHGSEGQNWPKAGDGIAFENPADTNAEQGGRVYKVLGNRLIFRRGDVDFSKIKPGVRVWKTSDPALERELRKSWQTRAGAGAGNKTALRLTFSGRAGQPLALKVEFAEGTIRLASEARLDASRKCALTTKALEDVFSRLNETPYRLDTLEYNAEDPVFLPNGELNRLKRAMVCAVEAHFAGTRAPSGITLSETLKDLRASVVPRCALGPDRTLDSPAAPAGASLSVLCRTMAQIEAAAGCGVKVLYADFEEIRRYKDAVDLIRHIGNAEIFLATPRIQKVGEDGFFKVIEAAGPDGVLIRNVGAISYFRRSSLRKLGDFSLNVSNPAAAAVFLSHGLERVTISYDLNIEQVLALLAAAPPEWFELSIHQHMPMFHMEHCVFAAFLSKGTSFLDCGRPCEKHRVHLRDRVGVEHPLRADVGCRNTLYNASAQTGAAYFPELRNAGLAHYRVELLEEEGAAAEAMLRAYQALLSEASNGAHLWRSLKAQRQLGVTRGKLIDAPR